MGSFREKISTYRNINTLFAGIVMLLYLPAFVFSAPPVLAYAVIASCVQSFVAILPLIIAGAVLNRLGVAGQCFSKWLHVGYFSVLFSLLYFDYTLFSLHGYHINAFVLNLVLTPGGNEFVSGASSGVVSYGLSIVLIVGVQLLMAGWIFKSEKRFPSLAIPRSIAIVLVLILFISDKLIYGAAHFYGVKSVLLSAHSLPAYIGVTFRSKLNGMELAWPTSGVFTVDQASASKLSYPLNPIVGAPDSAQPNIIWMTAESLRADMLRPDIMPNTWKFAQDHGLRYTQHYSGSNGTRMGMFSQFYGLEGRYWFNFFDERKPAALFTFLQSGGYDIRLYSGASFSYPEFDQTIFASIPNSRMQDNDKGALGAGGWQADQRNVNDLIAGLEQRGGDTSPYMRFIFFESAHARYYFPEDSVIRSPYMDDRSYSSVNLEEDKDLIFNRYINAVHHLDQQIGKVLDYLTLNDLLDNTIVVITGDHGEEFMESGYWGHNSEFTESQTRVPLVMAIPGRATGVIDNLSSHTDIIPTIMPLLGVKNVTSDYSTGIDLLSSSVRDCVVLSDWQRIGIITRDYKIYQGVDPTAWFSNKVTTANDEPVSSVGDIYMSNVSIMGRVFNQLAQFDKGLQEAR